MIGDIERDIARHIEAYRHNEPDALVEALCRVVHPRSLRTLLEAIISDEEMLRQAVQRSSIHNNGFLKIILATSPDYQVRLHVWDCREGEGEAVRESVHSHTADFSSMIILGAYRHEQFREMPDGDAYYSYGYRAFRGARSFSLTDTGVKHLQRVSDGRLPRGTIYTLAGDILHRVVPEPGTLTASLVIQGPRHYSFVQVFADEQLNAGSEIAVQPLPREKFVRYVGEITAHGDALLTPQRR
jgi:hypothetical protein